MQELDKLLMVLPNIILYFVSGFIFVKIFSFISSKKSPNDFQHIFLKSVVAGYVLTTISFSLKLSTNNYYLDIVIYLIAVVVLAYLVSLIYDSVFFREILRALKIRRTVNEYIWVDIQDKNNTLWVDVVMKDEGYRYLGILSSIEDFQRQPLIMLARYSKYTLDGEKLLDYTYEPTRKVLIDTSRVANIEFIYDKNSKNIDKATTSEDCSAGK